MPGVPARTSLRKTCPMTGSSKKARQSWAAIGSTSAAVMAHRRPASRAPGRDGGHRRRKRRCAPACHDGVDADRCPVGAPGASTGPGPTSVSVRDHAEPQGPAGYGSRATSLLHLRLPPAYDPLAPPASLLPEESMEPPAPPTSSSTTSSPSMPIRSLNLATFVTTYMDDEAGRLMVETGQQERHRLGRVPPDGGVARPLRQHAQPPLQSADEHHDGGRHGDRRQAPRPSTWPAWP